MDAETNDFIRSCLLYRDHFSFLDQAPFFATSHSARETARMATRMSRMSRTGHHHSVYVILLDDAVATHPSVLRLNPERDASKPCVYVGMTGLPVEHRFENHRHGYKSAWTVRKYGVRLLPELFAHLNPMPFEAAAQMEKDLAEELRTLGYTVTGGT